MNMNEISPTPGHFSNANEESHDWYYRIGERERGPMTLVQLTDLVASSGELAREIVVRHHTEGEWVPYEAVDAATARRLHADRSARPAQAPAAARGDSPPHADAVPAPAPALKRRPSLGERMRADWPILVGVLVWAGVNLVLWSVLDPFHRTERKYFDVLTKAAQQARDARAKGLDDASRGRIAAAAIQEIKPIVEDLKKTANASEPIRQHLLWAAKDQLPRLFSASGKELNECDGIFLRHMYEAGHRLGIDVPRPETQVSFQ
jgi:hypothetical protein